MENKANIGLIFGIVVVLVIAAIGIGLMMNNKGPATNTTTLETTTTQATTTQATTTTLVPATTMPPTTQATTTLPSPVTTLATTTTFNVPPGSNVHSVEIINFRYVPSELTIKKGDTVTWINNDILGDNPRIHLLNQYQGEFRSERLYYKDTFSHTFNTPGEYAYSDAVYPKAQVRGTIIVLDENGNMPTGSFIAQLNPMSGNPILFLLLSVIIAGMVTGYILGFRKQSY